MSTFECALIFVFVFRTVQLPNLMFSGAYKERFIWKLKAKCSAEYPKGIYTICAEMNVTAKA
jgi:hypothetical protein